jgi:glyoxylase-like metal-dependent hydrolase (beta-lactamase superfamily II)
VVREILPNVYLNKVPLPKNPLKVLNSYIICAGEDALVIDTGFNLPECREAFRSGLKELNVDPAKTRLVLTHMHADHAGLADELIDAGATAHMGKRDLEHFTGLAAQPGEMFRQLKKHMDLRIGLTSMGYTGFGQREYQPLAEGDVFEIGPYRLQVIDIPGHTPGQIGLFERDLGLFFCGDHILDEITPNIISWGLGNDYLGMYLNSLQKIYHWDINLLLTGHRKLVSNHCRRIDELTAHHHVRLDEVREILRSGEHTASGSAAKMRWDLTIVDWEKFPDRQKWFASGEAMAHLEHLVYLGEAERVDRDGFLSYSLKS